MQVKTIVNSKGEPQTSEIKIPLEGSGEKRENTRFYSLQDL